VVGHRLPIAERTYLLSSSVSAGPAAAWLLLSGSGIGVACGAKTGRVSAQQAGKSRRRRADNSKYRQLS
jgi:hypothetical protein